VALNPTLAQLAAIAAGGALGALARFGAGLWLERSAGLGAPYGTALVNVLGCGAVGYLWSVLEHHGQTSAGPRWLWITGFLGAFTTFSAFGLETLELVRNGRSLAAAANVLGQVTLCLLAVWLGRTLASAG
jgi:CrcB protein